MKTFLALALCISALCDSHAFAQVEPTPPCISVSGSAEIKVAPDQVEIHVGVETRDGTLATAVQESNAQVAAAQEPVVKEITVNVRGAVKNLSRITLPKGATILDALTAAGDASKDADLRRLRLLHKTTAENPDVTTINVTAILEGKAKDVVLQDGDTVVLPETAMTLKY